MYPDTAAVLLDSSEPLEDLSVQRAGLADEVWMKVHALQRTRP
jgi:hypothetical protein